MTTLPRRIASWLAVGALAVALAGCGGDETSSSGAEKDHKHTSMPAGDGTEPSYVGYSMTNVKFPAKAGVPGTLSFRIKTFRGKAQTEFVTELTKKMHVYVVRTDLSTMRHVHPEMTADGTWTGNLTVPTEGRYRVVAEFTAVDEGGNGDQVVLGSAQTLGRKDKKTPVPPASTKATADGVTVQILKAPTVGYDRRMEIGVSRDGKAANLGTYLGAYAHASAFHTKTGALVHMHPLGSPKIVKDRAVLTLHTGFEEPGDYRMFVQVRISGVVRAIPITINVTGRRAPEL